METKEEIQKTGAAKDLEEMSKAGILYGYSPGKRHPKMSPFIFGIRNNVEVFNILDVKDKLEEAEKFMEELGKGKKIVLFAGTKPAAREIIREAAEALKMPYVYERWLGGTLTNFRVIKSRIDKLAELKEKKQAGEFKNRTKKERLIIDKEMERLQRNFGGLENLLSLPDALLAVDSKEEATAVSEARKSNIPVIAILNTDCDPEEADYPIPANDSSVSSISFLINRLSRAYERGLKESGI